MGTALELIADLEQVNIKETALVVMKANAKEFTMLNQAQMLEGKGKTKNIGKYSGSPLGRKYSKMKKSMNPLAGEGNVDLRLTGSYYRGMRMEMKGDDIEMDSSDSKADDLLAKYGGNIYGLNEKNMPIFTEVAFMPDLQAVITDKTGLKFS